MMDTRLRLLLAGVLLVAGCDVAEAKPKPPTTTTTTTTTVAPTTSTTTTVAPTTSTTTTVPPTTSTTTTSTVAPTTSTSTTTTEPATTTTESSTTTTSSTTTSTTVAPTTTTTPATTTTVPQATRNPIFWPYPSTSFWNMPIGDTANLVPLGFNYGDDPATVNSRVTVAEENVLLLDRNAPQQYIMETNAGWNGTLTRCGSRTGRHLTGNGTVPDRTLPIPPFMFGTTTPFTTEQDPPYIGATPNMSGALLYTDGTDIKLYETQPLHVCTDGVPVSQFVNSSWVGDSIKTGGDGVKGGSHGGSYMSAFGGTIRLNELVPGGTIKHAVKVTMDTAWYASASGAAGHVWPALKADNGWATTYGSANPSVPAQAKMGMLLTLPASFDVESLTSEPARILGRAIRDYGAYLVDGDANAASPWYTAWQVERSNRGAFTTEFKSKWGFEFFHRPSVNGTAGTAQMQFRADVGRIMEAVCIVADNGPTNVGGAGARRAPMAPPLA